MEWLYTCGPGQPLDFDKGNKISLDSREVKVTLLGGNFYTTLWGCNKMYTANVPKIVNLLLQKW
jgi:hypothetical protein